VADLEYLRGCRYENGRLICTRCGSNDNRVVFISEGEDRCVFHLECNHCHATFQKTVYVSSFAEIERALKRGRE
jgi:hypothetical protein